MSGPQPHGPRSPLRRPALLHLRGDGGRPAPGGGAALSPAIPDLSPAASPAGGPPPSGPHGSLWLSEVHAGPSCPGPASLLMPLAEEGPRTSRRGARVVWRENAHDASCRLQDARGPGPRHGQTVAHWSPGPCPATTGLGRQSRASWPGGADARSSPPPPTWWTQTQRRRAPVPRGTRGPRWPRPAPRPKGMRKVGRTLAPSRQGP